MPMYDADEVITRLMGNTDAQGRPMMSVLLGPSKLQQPLPTISPASPLNFPTGSTGLGARGIGTSIPYGVAGAGSGQLPYVPAASPYVRGATPLGRGLSRGRGALTGLARAASQVGRGGGGGAGGGGGGGAAAAGAAASAGGRGPLSNAVQGVKASSWAPAGAGKIRGTGYRIGVPLVVNTLGGIAEDRFIDRSDGYSTPEAFGRGAIKGAQIGSWFGPAGTAVGAAGVGLGEGISNMIFPGQNRSITNVFDNVMSGNFSGEDIEVEGRPISYVDPTSGEQVSGDRTTILPSGERVWKDATALTMTAAEAGLDPGMQAQFSDSFEATRIALMNQGYDDEQASTAAYDITLSNLPQVVAQQQADARAIWKQNQLATMLGGYINEFGPKGGGPVAEAQRGALALLPAYLANQQEQEQVAAIANSVRQRQQQMALEQMFGGGGGGDMSLTAEDLAALAG